MIAWLCLANLRHDVVSRCSWSWDPFNSTAQWPWLFACAQIRWNEWGSVWTHHSKISNRRLFLVAVKAIAHESDHFHTRQTLQRTLVSCMEASAYVVFFLSSVCIWTRFRLQEFNRNFAYFQPALYHYSVESIRTWTTVNIFPFRLHPEPLTLLQAKHIMWRIL